MEDATNMLRNRFGFDDFRAGQKSVIELLLSQHATPDIPEHQTGRALAIFPTGAGKSLCYQLPGLLFEDGLTLVVSPLMALMKDQVDSLVAKDFSAACLDSSLTAAETRDLFDRVRANDVKILFVSPERFNNDRFLRLIKSVSVSLFAVDEAHCISEWGHSFRPDYLRLSRWANRIGCKRRLALTATATPKVAEDICKSMGIPFPAGQVRTPSVRPNLTTRVTCLPPVGVTGSLEKVMENRVEVLATRLRERPPGPTIIYVTLQVTATTVAEMLRKRGFIQAASYHAGMKKEERKTTQDEFMSNKKDAIVVATIAFGMGMDHSGIRYVYHLNMPKSLEGYIQEIGRAGRDGLPSTCESLVSIDDVPTLEGFIYGGTPAKSSVDNLVKHLLKDATEGGYIEYSTYDLCFEFDIRDNCIGQLLAQLDLSENLIEESTPFYGNIACRMPPVGQRKWPAPETVQGKLLALAKIGASLVHVDVVATSKELGLEYGKISRICDDMRNEGYFTECKAAKLRHRAVVKKLPEDMAKVSARLYVLLLRSRNQQLAKLQDVFRYYSAEECQTVALAKHLGDELNISGACGHCEFCINDGRQPVTIHQDVREREERELDERRWALIQLEALPKDNPLLMARFAAGISSPIISRKYRRLKTFGTMSDHDFNVLLRAAEKECGKQS